MKLYYSPGACSLSDHIALHEAGLAFDGEKVDLKSKRTENGADFTTVNPKGYVPALALDTGETLTENVAILDYIAHQHAGLSAPGPMGHSHLLQALAYISSEIHKSFKPYFSGASDSEKAQAATTIHKRLAYLSETFKGVFLLGDTVSVADCYLFVMLLWAKKNGIELSPHLEEFRGRMLDRPAVKLAMKHEGLS